MSLGRLSWLQGYCRVRTTNRGRVATDIPQCGGPAGHRQKFKNIERDPRVTITIWDKEDPYSFVEVRGEVVGKEMGPQAREHIDALSYKYHGKPYGTRVRSERVVLRIAALRQVIRTPS